MVQSDPYKYNSTQKYLLIFKPIENITYIYVCRTPSIPNYKTSQESWRVKTILSLTKIIERNIKIYDIKLMYYKNITNKESNST